jgi:hypothetical protein
MCVAKADEPQRNGKAGRPRERQSGHRVQRSPRHALPGAACRSGVVRHGDRMLVPTGPK